VDVFDSHFHQVQLAGSFTDPNIPAGFAPFGIKNVNGTLFVTYAKQLAPDNHDDQAGPGNGFIDEFDTSGHLLKRFASGTAAGGTLTQLNSPIGMAVAPDDYGPGGKFSGALLVGNFGDSHVSAFDLHTGAFLGQLSDAHGQPLTLNGGVGGRDTKGLWGIAFGNGRGGAGTDTLFFAAGINDEADGLFGKVTMAGRDHDRDDGHDRDDRHHDGHGHDGESVALGTFVGKGFADSRADDSAARQGHGPSGSDGPGARGAGRDALLTAPPPVQAGADSLTSVVHRRKDQEFDAFDQDALE
jgi:hypothetical protein